MVLVLSMSTYKCGGSLIHPNVILTVAHCVDTVVDRPSLLQVRAGQWNIGDQLEPYQERNVTEIVIHPAYNSSRYSLHNDIALLVVGDRPFRMANTVNTLCLVSVALASHRWQAGRRCVVTGWGKNETGPDGRYQPILKKITVPLVEQRWCERRLRRTRLGGRFRLHDSFLCAGGERGRDACTGDGGSPLICAIEGGGGEGGGGGGGRIVRYQQIGIVALGVGCGNTVPG